MDLLPNITEKAEKGRGEVRTPADRFAYWLSQVASPFVVGLCLLGYIALSTAATVLAGLLWLTIIAVGMLIPLVFVWWGVRKGWFTDIHVSRRSQRLLPLLVGLACLCGILGGLLCLRASHALIATLVAVLITFSLATAITQVARYKISFHIGSAAGAVTACCLLISPFFLALSPLLVLIAWARWKLEAHSPLQALSGAALAVVITVATFGLFGLL